MGVRLRLILAVVVLSGLAGVAASALWRHAQSPTELATGTYFSSPRSMPDFSLIDQHGAPFSTQNLQGHWSILFFGYTNCPDFCPTTLALLSAFEKHRRAEGTGIEPRVLFVSVDAKRDTPAQLARYVPYFDPQFQGLTAKDQPTIEALARQLGVAVILEPPRADGSYTVDHSGVLYVVDPSARIRAILTGPFTVSTLDGDFNRIVAAHG